MIIDSLKEIIKDLENQVENAKMETMPNYLKGELC